MPSPDPDEAPRILAFLARLARLAEHDAMLPPPAQNAGAGPERPVDGAVPRTGVRPRVSTAAAG